MERTPPRWPTVMLALFAILATLSLLQGIADLVIPTLTGERPFGFLFQMTEQYGAPFFIAYIFIHNLGLACLVPGYGFLAAYYERKTANRALVGWLLAGSVLSTLLVAAQFIFTMPGFHMATSLALLVGEAAGVMALAVASAIELRGFVPTREYRWALVKPFNALKVPFAYSVAVLLLLSVVEAYTVLGA